MGKWGKGVYQSNFSKPCFSYYYARERHPNGGWSIEKSREAVPHFPTFPFFPTRALRWGRGVTTPHPRLVALARRVLTDVEYLTWALHQAGLTQRDIAMYRRRSRGTIADTLSRAEDKISAAQMEEVGRGLHEA